MAANLVQTKLKLSTILTNFYRKETNLFHYQEKSLLHSRFIHVNFSMVFGLVNDQFCEQCPYCLKHWFYLKQTIHAMSSL